MSACQEGVRPTHFRSNAGAKNSEEYDPAPIPINNDKEKYLNVSPPNTNMARRDSITVNEMLNERNMVCCKLLLTVSWKSAPSWRTMFSRIRSKSTTVSL